jgi:hypothetical protein
MSEPNPAAALAGQLDELRQRLDKAEGDVAAARATVARWDARLEQDGIGATLMMRHAFKKLNEKVENLAKTLADALDRGQLKTPAAPRWDNLDQAEEVAQLTDLRDWVTGVLRVQYPDYTFPACWEGHRMAVWELGNLCAEWKRIYTDPHGADLEAALWFHERWLPGTIGRLNRAIHSDGAFGCRLHGAGARVYGQRMS